jgi:hypothetical protein
MLFHSSLGQDYLYIPVILCNAANLCVKRFGVALPATDVGHIIPMRAGGAPWDSEQPASIMQAVSQQ